MLRIPSLLSSALLTAVVGCAPVAHRLPGVSSALSLEGPPASRPSPAHVLAAADPLAVDAFGLLALAVNAGPGQPTDAGVKADPHAGHHPAPAEDPHAHHHHHAPMPAADGGAR
jgi:hypothetical protein